ncbi:hypothetical protein ACMD2_02028 [Ananas comosus]|uniref:Histidine-containing phosphotransfer protein n=1 Tax=Ananas comosus TaxID=4615 RepID=A0A199W4E7_ANACO|nr:hypothetical protein ACMD2_02028 [Ananas comosus]
MAPLSGVYAKRPLCKGYLDEQFYQLEELQDEASPNFVEEVVALFFKDSLRLMSNIDQALEKHPRDFHRLDSLMHQLKGSVSSIGALRMKNECTLFKEHCDEQNIEGYVTNVLNSLSLSMFTCQRSFQKVKREHAALRQKLETYFQLLRQAGPAEKATRSGV